MTQPVGVFEPVKWGDIIEELYDLEDNVETRAEVKGKRIVYPESNELQIDIDSANAWDQFLIMLSNLEFAVPDKLQYEVVVSSSGLPHRHVTVKMLEDVTDWQRVCLQLLLGSDFKRETLNACRLLQKMDDPVVFFEEFEDAEEGGEK